MFGHFAVLKAMHAKGGSVGLLDQQGGQVGGPLQRQICTRGVCCVQSGYYAIHWAAQNGHVDAVNVLIEFGGRAELDKRTEVFFVLHTMCL